MYIMYRLNSMNVINLYGIESYMYSMTELNKIRLEIKMGFENTIVVFLSKEEFNEFEDAIKNTLGFYIKDIKKKTDIKK